MSVAQTQTTSRIAQLGEALARCEAGFDAQAFEIVRQFAQASRELPGSGEPRISTGSDEQGMSIAEVSQETVNRCVWVLLMRGQVEDAFSCAWQNHARCDALNASPDIRALTARTLGAMYTELGDGVHALETLVAALKTATESKLVLRQVQVWNSLGLLFCMYGDNVEARACFMRATGFFGDPALPHTETLPAWMNLAVLSFRTRAYEEGMQFTAMCDGLSPQGPGVLGKWRNARVVVARAKLLLASERVADAHKDFATLQSLAEGLEADDPLMGDVLQLEGLLAIFDGHADAGAQKLAQALQLCRYSSRVREELIDACVWAFEKANRWDLAASFLKQAVDEKARGSHVAFALRIASIADWRNYSARGDETSRVVLGGERSAQEKLHRLNEILLEQEYLERLSVTTELRDDATGGHCYRVGRVAARLGREIGLDRITCDTLEVAGRLHDIGKV
ncbi:MAG: HD domain-containing protein, partial [Betaproteobacteria bacterium]